MAAVTPGFKPHEGLAPLASRYVSVADLPWTPTRYKGVDMKVLLEDKERGLMTALVRFAPGSTLPDHEHVEIEQSYVLEGAFEDHEGRCTAGDFVWRPAGNRHAAHSKSGALMLAVFLKPNKFFA